MSKESRKIYEVTVTNMETGESVVFTPPTRSIDCIQKINIPNQSRRRVPNVVHKGQRSKQYTKGPDYRFDDSVREHAKDLSPLTKDEFWQYVRDLKVPNK